MISTGDIAKTIDHAVLKPQLTRRDVAEACALAHKFGVATVCVRPTDVADAARELAQAAVGVSTVIGFPHGSQRPEVKALEARLAMEDGAVELDMVMNIGRFLSDDTGYVLADMQAVVNEARKRSVPVKVILETCYLSPTQITEACGLARAAGAAYVKTSTGFGDGGATPEAVAVMLRAAGDDMGVKASGGIRTREQAVAYLQQGCRRLGTGSTARILEES